MCTITQLKSNEHKLQPTMIRLCGLLTFLFLLPSVPAHPMMMGGDVDATISTLSAEMSTVPPLEGIAISTDEQVTSTSKTSAEETVIDEPTTAAVLLDSSTILSTITPSIVGMTNLIDATTTTHVMDNKIQEPATSTPLTLVLELTTLPQTVETNSVVPSDTATHLMPASELSTTMQAVETNSVVPSDTTTHLTPESEVSTMDHAVDSNSVVTPPETMTTIPPITLLATTITMTMATSSQNTNNEISNPPSGTVSSADHTTEIPSIAALFGGEAAMENVGDIVNVLTMSSNEETTRMATSTASKVDGGDKPPAPLAAVTEPPKPAVTEPPKPQDTNELGGGNSGCHCISTSFAILCLGVLYVIV